MYIVMLFANAFFCMKWKLNIYRMHIWKCKTNILSVWYIDKGILIWLRYCIQVCCSEKVNKLWVIEVLLHNKSFINKETEMYWLLPHILSISWYIKVHIFQFVHSTDMSIYYYYKREKLGMPIEGFMYAKQNKD